MWRYFRKRRALRAYRTTLFKQLRRTYGRKLYYTPEEVTYAARDLRDSRLDFICYALGMFCEREAFDAYHAARGEACDYEAMRVEIFAHVANAPVVAGLGQAELVAGCAPTGHDHAADDGGHHESSHHDSSHHDSSHHDVGGHHHIADSFDGGGGFDGGSHH